MQEHLSDELDYKYIILYELCYKYIILPAFTEGLRNIHFIGLSMSSENCN